MSSSRGPGAWPMSSKSKRCRSGQRLTRQLLAFSRQEPIEPAPLDLNESVSITSGMLHKLLGKLIRWKRSSTPARRTGRTPDKCSRSSSTLRRTRATRCPRQEFRIETRLAGERAGGDAQRRAPGDYVVARGKRHRHRHVARRPVANLRALLHHQRARQGYRFGLATVYGIVRQSNGFMDVQRAPSSRHDVADIFSAARTTFHP